MLSTLLSKHSIVAQDLKQQYLHVLVDEFQDVSPIQMQIITQLSLTSVTVCGDDDQNIFGFLQRNGDNFSLFLDRFPNAGDFEFSEYYLCFTVLIVFLSVARNFEARTELSVHVKHCKRW